MTKPTIEERIEKLRKELNVPVMDWVHDALAIIDELLVSMAELGTRYAQQVDVIDKQQREIERLKAKGDHLEEHLDADELETCSDCIYCTGAEVGPP